MEDAMLIHRIMRAPERRIFKIDVGNLPPESIDGYMEEITNNMKKIPYVDPVTGDYNLRFNLMNMLEDFYLPTRGADSATSIESLPGLTNDGSLDDIEYLQKKQMAYLKIPKAYLGYDEGVDGKGTLAAEDIKFARFIERIQKIIVSELQKIGHIHLYMQGYRDEDLVDFSLELLSDEKKDVTFYKTTYDEKCTGNSLYREKTLFYDDEHIITENRVTTTLETLLNDKYFDLIKIDVQGSELDIIKGGLDIVKNSKGVILEVSLTEYNENSPTKEEVYEFMYNLGFNHSEIIGHINHPLTHELIQHDVLFVKITN
jgi:FkbM family methyltransferase